MIAKTVWSQDHPQTIFLARHGQSESNCEGRIAGQTNPTLTEKGRRQAQRLSNVLRYTQLTKVVTSSLRRSIETARPTAELQGLTTYPLEAINEISFGILEGQLRHHLDQASQSLLDQWSTNKLHFRVPHGENLVDVSRRVRPALSQVCSDNPGGTILIVGHRHTNLVILSALLGWDLHSITDIPIQSTYLYEIHYASTPRIYTIRLTGEARGTRIEGFFSGENALNGVEEQDQNSTATVTS